MTAKKNKDGGKATLRGASLRARAHARALGERGRGLRARGVPASFLQ